MGSVFFNKIQIPSPLNQIAAVFLLIDINLDLAEGDVTF